MPLQNEIQKKLALLQAEYLADLPEKIQHLEVLWNALLDNPDNSNQVKITLHAFHRLAGSGGSYGFEHITRHCREIEETIEVALVQGKTIDASTKKKVDALLLKLSECDTS